MYHYFPNVRQMSQLLTKNPFVKHHTFTIFCGHHLFLKQRILKLKLLSRGVQNMGSWLYPDWKLWA